MLTQRATTMCSEQEQAKKEINETIKIEYQKVIEQIRKLPKTTLEKKITADNKFKEAFNSTYTFGLGNKGIIKHEVQFYNHILPIADMIVNQLQSLNIQESEYDATILMHLKKIFTYIKHENIEETTSAMYRDIAGLANKKLTEMNIEKELFLIELNLKTKRILPEIKKELKNTCKEFIEEEIDPRIHSITNKIDIIEMKFNEKEIKLYTEVENLKKLFDQKETNLNTTIQKSSISLCRISLCMLCGIFAYNSYNRLIKIYNENSEIKKYKQSMSNFLKTNLTHIADGLVFLGTIFYIFQTPFKLTKIWQSKD